MIATDRFASARVFETSGERLSVQLTYRARRSEKSQRDSSHSRSCMGLRWSIAGCDPISASPWHAEGRAPRSCDSEPWRGSCRGSAQRHSARGATALLEIALVVLLGAVERAGGHDFGHD